MVAGEDVFHNCQPQPCAARAARPASVHTVEPFGQAGEVFAGDADAGVFDAKHAAVLADPPRQANGAAVWGVAHGIRHQIAKRTVQFKVMPPERGIGTGLAAKQVSPL